MQANALMDFGPEGKQWAQWYPSFKFEGDYLRFIPGVHQKEFKPENGGFLLRGRLDWKER